MAVRRIDCTGMSCPMPIVEIAKAVRAMEPGDVLEVTANDLAFKLDVEAWSRKTGHALASFEEGDVQVAEIRVK